MVTVGAATPWIGLAQIAAMTMFFVGVVLFLMSRIFGVKKLETWARLEMIEAVITLFLIFLYQQGVQAELNRMALNYLRLVVHTGPSTPLTSPPDFAIYRFKLINEKLLDYRHWGYIGILLKGLSSYLMEVGYTNAVGVGPSMFGKILSNIFYMSMKLYFVYLILLDIFYMFNYIMPLLIPFGIILRIFPYTRSAGAFLIAFGLGFYFVFPLVYIMLAGPYPYAVDIPKFVMSGPTSSFSSNPLTAFVSFISKIVSLASYIFNFVFKGSYKYLTKLLLEICFFPFFAFASTMTFVNIFTTALGGRISEIGRGIIKFI